MSKILIGQPVNGISLNGLEYLLDESSSKPLRFQDEYEAKAFLRDKGLDANTIASLHFVREKRKDYFRPSDAKLNAKIAEVCGRSKEDNSPLPDYCNDRNALPEIWGFLEANKKGKIHALFVMTLTKNGVTYTTWPALKESLWLLVNAPPRLHVEAALSVLGHWNSRWRSSRDQSEAPSALPMAYSSGSEYNPEDEDNLLEMQSVCDD